MDQQPVAPVAVGSRVLSEQIDAARLASLLPAVEKSFKTSALSVVIFSALLFRHAPVGMATWLAVRAVASVLCVVALRRLAQRDQPAQHVIRSLSLLMAASGVVWGLLALMLQPAEPEWRAVIVLWIFGNQSVVTAVCAPSRTVFRAAIGTVTGVGAISMLGTGDGFSVVLAGVILLGGVYSTSIFEAMHRTTSAAIEGRLAAVQLAESLEHRRAQLRVANASLRQLADHDGLTGLLNRRALMNELGDPDERSRAQGWLGLVDVDRFKSINDTHGHAAGDEVLAVLARRWDAAVGSDALVARFGGDEFAIFAPSQSSSGASAMASAMLDAARQPIEIGNGVELVCSCSIGVVDVVTAEPLSEAFVRADIALYSAKASGRDQAVVGAVSEMVEV